MNWYYRTLNPEVGEALAEIKRANVARLPIREVDLHDAADRAQHDRMIELVENISDLQERVSVARTAHSKTNLQRQIDATDTQIDRLVYELYELTPDEIETVKNTVAKAS